MIARRLERFDEYRRLVRTLAFTVTSSSVVLCICAAIGIYPVLRLVDKVAYTNNLSLFYILLIACFANAFSFIAHYQLYARRKDRVLVFTSLSLLALSFVVASVLIPRFGLRGAAASAALSAVFLATAKTAANMRASTWSPTGRTLPTRLWGFNS